MKNFLLIALLAFSQIALSQVGINTDTPDPDSDLTLASEDKGLLLNRVELTETTDPAPLSAHVAGMTVYNTATNGDDETAVTPGYYYNDGTKWVRIATGADAKTEPWFDQATNTEATENTQNIYQMGKVAIGRDEAVAGARLDVAGSVSVGEGNTFLNDIEGLNSLAVGMDNLVGVRGLVVGNDNTVTGASSFAVGSENEVTGPNSVAMGVQAKATATGAIAMGNLALAEGAHSIVLGGSNNTSSGNNALSGGTGSVASGNNSVAFGENNIASGQGAVALGTGNEVAGLYGQAYGAFNTVSGSSIAMVQGNTVAGNYSFVSGTNNTVSSGSSKAMILGDDNEVGTTENTNFGSITLGRGNRMDADGYVMGELNRINAYGALVLGYEHIAANPYETILGHHNAITTKISDIPNAPLLQLGNGTSSTRANALTITNRGYIGTDLATTPTQRLDIGSGNVRVRDINTVAGTATDKIVVADTDGVLKTIDASTMAAMPKFFYMPSIIIPTSLAQLDAPGSGKTAGDSFNDVAGEGTIDLHARYTAQFGTPMVTNTTQTTTLPTLTATQLDYNITWYDINVFENVEVSNTGIMTYELVDGADITVGSFMNIVFSVK